MNQSARWQAKVIGAIHASNMDSKRIWDVNGPPVEPQDQFYRGHAAWFRTALLVHLQYVEMESRSESVSDAHDETF